MSITEEVKNCLENILQEKCLCDSGYRRIENSLKNWDTDSDVAGYGRALEIYKAVIQRMVLDMSGNIPFLCSNIINAHFENENIFAKEQGVMILNKTYEILFENLNKIPRNLEINIFNTIEGKLLKVLRNVSLDKLSWGRLSKYIALVVLKNDNQNFKDKYLKDIENFTSLIPNIARRCENKSNEKYLEEFYDVYDLINLNGGDGERYSNHVIKKYLNYLHSLLMNNYSTAIDKIINAIFIENQNLNKCKILLFLSFHCYLYWIIEYGNKYSIPDTSINYARLFFNVEKMHKKFELCRNNIYELGNMVVCDKIYSLIGNLESVMPNCTELMLGESIKNWQTIYNIH